MLTFRVEGAQVPLAASPCLTLSLAIRSAAPARGLLLQTQVRIDAQRRPYSAAEEPGLRDLFGERARWPDTIKSLLWANVALSVPPFDEAVTVDLTLPCSLDLSLAATRWFEALEGGVLAEECGAVMKAFFRERRGGKRDGT